MYKKSIKLTISSLLLNYDVVTAVTMCICIILINTNSFRIFIIYYDKVN